MYFHLQCESRSGDWDVDEPLDRTVAEFEVESLDDLLERIGRFVRGCGYVVDHLAMLEFVNPDDATPDHLKEDDR